MIPVITWDEGSAPAFDPRKYVSVETFDKLTKYLECENVMHPRNAQRVIEQAISLLKLRADNPDLRLTASFEVEMGLRACVLHTDEYARLCVRLGGFVHYEPPISDDRDEDDVQRTIARMRAAGLPVHDDVWTQGGSSCFRGDHARSACDDV
ncbi:hypothetical protein [Actinomadura rubrisoli]|uniref:Uncharacterized protein n=1 Tax=Actinomadura rubrisoli TaxID=2530368 RepID=A0A4V2YT15_9ACTN|nr:hypothetical protein [Actinomadura rubrisoli]TDD72137.1 hypothetical protein E1298_35295 [Actinomadura rubrisoli]